METKKLEELISENTEIFRRELTKVVNPTFDGLENPEKYEGTINDILRMSKRLPFRRQARLIAAATEHLVAKDKKSLIISSEMGTGKTQLAINISQNKKFKSIMIMCPPHLVNKWEDEILKVYEDNSNIKIVKVKRWTDLIPYAKKKINRGNKKYFFILSRETSKLSYPKVPVVQTIKRLMTIEKVEADGLSTIKKGAYTIEVCPDCYTVLHEPEEDFANKTPYKCSHCGSILRQVDKSVSPSLQTRMSVAEYVKRQFHYDFDLLICDEVHEYKGGSTGQGNALAQMVSKSKKVIGLTGTLLNGYASSLFYILYRLNPRLMQELGFDYNQGATC